MVRPTRRASSVLPYVCMATVAGMGQAPPHYCKATMKVEQIGVVYAGYNALAQEYLFYHNLQVLLGIIMGGDNTLLNLEYWYIDHVVECSLNSQKRGTTFQGAKRKWSLESLVGRKRANMATPLLFPENICSYASSCFSCFCNILCIHEGNYS